MGRRPWSEADRLQGNDIPKQLRESVRPVTEVVPGRVPVAVLLPIVWLALLVLRRPEAILAAEPFAESAPVFYLPTFFADPVTLLVTPYAGYLHTINRLIAQLERASDPSLAPLVATILTLLITVAIAAFLASRRMALILPAQWQRYAFATALVLAPAVYELLAVDISLYVYLAVYLVALAVASPPTTPAGRITDIAGGSIAALTGPFSILFAPLFWLRRHWLAPLVTACAGVHLIFLLSSEPRRFYAPDPAILLEVAALRVSTAILGSPLSTVAPSAFALVLFAGLAVVAARGVPVRTWGPFTYAAVVVAVAGVAVTGPAIATGPAAAERYFLLITLTCALIVIAGIDSPDRPARVVARALGVVLVVGVITGFRVEPFQDGTWTQRSACIGSKAPCIVHVEPSRFSVEWPGRTGSYQPPRTWPP